MHARERNLLILGGIVAALVLVGFYVLLLGPLIDDLDQRADARDERQARLDELEAEVARLEEVQRNSPELQRQLLELNRRVPTQPEVDTFLVQIEDVARDAGVTQTEFVRGDPEPPEGGGDFTVQPVTMSFEGTYDQLLNFLTRADDLTRLLAVNDVTYEVTGEGTTAAPDIEQNLRVQIEGEVFFQPTGVPDGDAPAAPEPPETTTGTSPEVDEGDEGG